jgi:uncharacterized membrane protein YhaH (DUF805 family)
MNWYLDALKKYAVFNGRARRKEYWMFSLLYTLISVVMMVIDHIIGTIALLTLLYVLAHLIPHIAVTVRRIHDTGRSGWWILVAFFPVIGPIVLFLLMIQDGTPGKNLYGQNPKEIAGEP